MAKFVWDKKRPGKKRRVNVQLSLKMKKAMRKFKGKKKPKVLVLKIKKSALRTAKTGRTRAGRKVNKARK